jgi:hypothetical protein
LGTDFPNTSFGTDRESNGLLELNSEDAGFTPEGILNIGARLIDPDYYFTPGAGGYVKGVFEINHGFFDNSGFSIGIGNYGPDFTHPATVEGASIGVATDSSGNIYAGYGGQGSNNINLIDFTDELLGVTDITLLLELNSLDQVTGSLDFGSDGTYEFVAQNFTTMSFTPGDPDDVFTGEFEAFEEAFSVPEPTTSMLLGIGLFLIYFSKVAVKKPVQ